MRTAKLLALAALTIPTSCAVAGCMSDARNGSERDRSHEALGSNTVGGGGDFGGGSGQWGGGGSLFAGGNGFWGGGGNWAGGNGVWSGGSGVWGGGSGQWSGGGDLFAGGSGFWNGGSGNWNGGGNNWGGGGNWWGGGGSNFAGGGSNFAGGGSNFSGGSGLWNGGSGLWSGGFAAAFPFVGWSGARNWQFRGVPQPASMNGGTQYQAAVPSTWPAFSGTGDTSACSNGYVRLGGFNVNFDADGWPGFLALGYSSALCIPTPGGSGLRVQATAGDGSMMGIGGYVMNGDAPTATTSNAQRDAYMMTSLVGAGTANVATQYGGALCASIGTLAAARRSCAVGIAMSDPNTAKDGTLTPRGVTVKSGAQSGVDTYNTPFGRPDGHGLYGQVAGDMESYANHVMQEHQSLTVPTSASGINAWNSSNFASTPSFKGSDFAPRGLTASPGSTTASASASAADMLANINRSLVSPSNMVPIDAIPDSSTDPLQIERKADLSSSVATQNGRLYALNLHTLAEQQNPLYGSGGGRWFFHAPLDGTKPLLDLSAIYQAPSRFLTGQLAVGTGTLAKSYLSESSIAYADWHANPTGTFGIDHAGQWPATIGSDADREARLRAAMVLPSAPRNLASGEAHTCSLDVGGGVQCWGSNAFGQLGNGTGADSSTPVQVSGLTSGVIALSGYARHTCAVLDVGTVQCWGENYYGGSPVQVSGLTSGAIATASGWNHDCALLSSGGVMCWGMNPNGQLGNGGSTSWAWSGPVQVVGLTSGVTGIVAAAAHTCARLSSGALQCWGWNNYGQLGNNTTTSSSTPVQVSGLTSGVISMEASWRHVCAALSTGAVKCWGYNAYGQLGDGSTTDRWTPVQVSGLTSGVAQVGLGDSHTCALLATGAVQCWGRNEYSQLGDGTTTNRTTPTPTSFQGTALAMGPEQTCVRASSGSVSCAGSDRNFYPTPQLTLVTSGATSISAGETHVCALVSGGVQCWGENTGGQLGNGTNEASTGPVQVSGLTSGVTAVAAGGTHTCALLATGAVKCWGYNEFGALGDGTNLPKSTPVQVSGLTSGVTAIGAGWRHTCALLATGAVKCWGDNAEGQLGNNSTKNSFTPVQVSGLTSGITAIAVRDDRSCALSSGGALLCWGYNGYGQLGDGSLVNRTKAVTIFTSGVTAVATGTYHTCAVANGALQCWGYNSDGQLGDGTTTSKKSPVQVSGLGSGVTAIAGGHSHTCVQLSTGAVQCWGNNGYGELGTGNIQRSVTPVQVSGLTSGVSAVTAGEEFTCALIAATGALQCWGWGELGQLGLFSAAPPAVAGQGFSNGALVYSQASVLVRKFAAASGTVTGHVTPIAYTMANAVTGNQALVVTYDPLAAAAAMFIDQYQTHVDACNRTTSESIAETDQQAGTYLWACSNANAKSAYLSGMQTLLAGARTYLFGRSDGSATAPCSGTTSPSYCIDTTQAHMPYTFVVPAYTEAAYNPEYYGQLDTALGNYRTAIFGSNASALHKSLQLAGIATFDTDYTAIVTTRVKRSGAFGAACVTP